ncbi:uncharacterized protein LOC110464620 [Mizuhopecten yessoensis]|uniref:uncharacterized protein LOC110464620 n=1 Tax=Mizuhopecten yessoensis TaxID=6573 RepID=UPI000B457C49|nr:uncharacterized protein LOC110464620 [Mizuhopecten yessoensis]XP_021375614.1 uncharacterized protein LOC110464620 [Mizuhopecten yessoensis]
MTSTGKGSNFDYLWAETESERKQALSTPFVQGVKDGTLDPVTFGGFVVQDCIYLYRQYKAIIQAEKSAKPGVLKTFLIKLIVKYEGYYKGAFKLWHIDDPSGIKLGKAGQTYVDFVDKEADEPETIYFLVSIAPCLKLWSWLGTQIGTKHGAYDQWVTNNFVGGSTLKSIVQFIDEQKDKLDRVKALAIFKEGMGHEYKFFNSAGK